ncbi:DegT/DnrJ/EryC1/StrS family aminotransferase [Reichenbachiella versicolor]|uniref:DegT/DnrJ/EryC1/StrS family aminotransferase n=1 Tax=Reichenbachiella versicolor TaxID=1821036 RepID=UPI000D6E9A73|nr:DegT/DnrJ/EryC1/StrS family aminotransferase [Reichenbachiella versicolor]
MISVNKPFLPPQSEYLELVEDIWSRNWLTNDGPLVRKLENKLREKLEVANMRFVSNGTIALQIAIKALSLSGEIITTPFSYIATCNSILWENCTPIFVDIDPNTFNIDTDLIEAAITDRTTGILSTHVFGNPCDISSITKISRKRNLRVIYDAAHCFGTKYMGKSVFNYGDISTVSFHATKVFHTVEGGGIVCNHDGLLNRVTKMRNFGHDGPEKFTGLGINGKNSEFHAAMGLVNLRYIDNILKDRRRKYSIYQEALASISGRFQQIEANSESNYSYFPVVFSSEKQCLNIKRALEEKDIFPRRYFFPSLNKICSDTSSLKNAESVASSVLCFPQHFYLTENEIKQICKLTLSC